MRGASFFRFYLSIGILVATLTCDMPAAFSQALPDAFEKPPIELNEWVSTTSFMGPRASHAAVSVNNRIYLLGGYSAAGNSVVYFKDVQIGSIGNDGLLTSIGWIKAESFNIERSGLAATTDGKSIYLSGGYGQGGTLNDVQYARINPDGTIGAWSPSPNTMIVPRSNHRLEIISTRDGRRFLAAIAGVGQVGSDTVHFDNIEVAEIALDGSVGEWRMCPFHIKGGRSAPVTFLHNNYLYVIGGWGDLLLSDVFADIQYAPIRPDGCADPWYTNETRLLMPLYGHTGVVLGKPGNQAALILGGNAGNGNYLGAAQSASLSDAGGTSRWFLSRSPVPIARWGHATVLYNDFIYVIGGAARIPGGFLADVQVSKYKTP